MRRTELYARFAPLSALCLVIATFGFDVAARASVRNHSLADAVSQSVEQIVDAPFFTFLLVVPFVALASLTAEAGKAANAKVAGVYFAVFASLLGYIYFSGYWGAQTALQNGAWTAASLSVPMIPFWSIAIVVLAGITVAVIERKYRRET
jgi:hypothetical protein